MTAEIVLLTELEAMPEWLRVLPRGKVELVDGREPFEVDEEALQQMVAAFRSRGVDLVIDYEHQSLQGNRAPAAGWIKVLETREDGLWANVEWTEKAREYLRSREYRYFSPVLSLDPKSRKPVALLQVALTNVPAIKDLPAVVARRQGDFWAAAFTQGAAEEGVADPENRREDEGSVVAGTARNYGKARVLEKLKARLGVEPQIEEESLWGEVEGVLGRLTSMLELPEGATAAQLAGAVTALRDGGARVIALQEEVDDLKSRLAEEAVAREVEAALKAGKISPAQREWALKYCRQDGESFKAYVAQIPLIVPVDTWLRVKPDDPENPGAESLSPADLAICQQLSLTPAQFLAAKAQTERVH